jgi:hypothetical protein
MISLLKYLHKEAWLKSQAFFVVDIELNRLKSECFISS